MAKIKNKKFKDSFEQEDEMPKHKRFKREKKKPFNINDISLQDF